MIRRTAAPLTVAIAFFLSFAAGSSAARLALDDYVARPDPVYNWKLVRKIAVGDGHGYVLEMTSQKWLTRAEVNRPVWTHWVNIVLPAQVKHSTALLFIGGGSNDTQAPKTIDSMFQKIASALGIVVAEVRMVPNQPLVFAGDGRERSEDAIIAYAWRKFLETGKPEWLPRLPMTKAAVRAMDTATAFCRQNGVEIDHFIVAGGSKRGWTTWTTAAVDKRVVAIAPMVIDVLNLEPSMIHHYRAYGFWAPAIADYEREGIMDWIGTERFRTLLRQVDPYQFRERFTMPKYLINSTGDQFFLPDSSRFYFKDLPGEKLIRYVPNTGHSLDGGENLVESFAAWMGLVLENRPRPRLEWEFPGEGGIVARADTRPRRVRLWQAYNPKARDFRVDVLGKVWKASTLQPGPGGVYHAQPPKPKSGWRAYFLEFTFEAGKFPLIVTTPVRVVPDTLPYPAPKPAAAETTAAAAPARVPALAAE